MAAEPVFDKKYGIKIIPSKEALRLRSARQARQWRAGHVPRARWPDLRRAASASVARRRTWPCSWRSTTTARPSRCRRSWLTRRLWTAPRWLLRYGQPTRVHLVYIFSRPAPTRCGCITGWLPWHQPGGRCQAHHCAATPRCEVANMRVGNMDGFCVASPEPPRPDARHHRQHHARHLDGPTRRRCQHHARVRRRGGLTARAVDGCAGAFSRWTTPGLQNKLKMGQGDRGPEVLHQHVEVEAINQHVPGSVSPERPRQASPGTTPTVTKFFNHLVRVNFRVPATA